jgi:hypothetical protein
MDNGDKSIRIFFVAREHKVLLIYFRILFWPGPEEDFEDLDNKLAMVVEAGMTNILWADIALHTPVCWNDN